MPDRTVTPKIPPNLADQARSTRIAELEREHRHLCWRVEQAELTAETSLDDYARARRTVASQRAKVAVIAEELAHLRRPARGVHYLGGHVGGYVELAPDDLTALIRAVFGPERSGDAP